MAKVREKTIAVSAFKPRSLETIDELASRRTARVVLTKRGKAVAALVPVDAKPYDPLGGDAWDRSRDAWCRPHRSG
jgi:antitoxin (DNA-binding transcriptional repressor) of toxin-antitoxin stability system